jgi:hypothetical protein
LTVEVNRVYASKALDGKLGAADQEKGIEGSRRKEAAALEIRIELAMH